MTGRKGGLDRWIFGPVATLPKYVRLVFPKGRRTDVGGTAKGQGAWAWHCNCINR